MSMDTGTTGEAAGPEAGASRESQRSVKKNKGLFGGEIVSLGDFTDGGPCVPEGAALGFRRWTQWDGQTWKGVYEVQG